jgi:hypothetical protein
LVNSRLGLVSAPPPRSTGVPLHLRGSPFSRSYGANLPSSLTRAHPSTLVLSYPATCVGLRYGRSRLPPRGFSRRPGSTQSPNPEGSSPPRLGRPPAPKARPRPARLDAAAPSRRSAYPAPHHGTTCSSASGNGISTVCPSPTPVGLGLGPTNPTRMYLPSEPSAIRWACLLTGLALLMPAFALVRAPPPLPGRLRRANHAPLPHPSPAGTGIRSFGSGLEPRWIVGARPLDQ